MIAPELAPEQLYSEAEAEAESPEVARFQLYEGLLEALEMLRSGEGLAVALDDLHRADTSTLGFLRFAARELRQSPILFLATCREGELRQSPFHTRALAELAREPHATSVCLRGLSPNETTQLYDGISSQNASTEEASLIFAQTGGNPFFVRQLAALVGTERTSPMQPTGSMLPPTLRDAILDQTTGLNETARIVLSACAVLGREISARTLQDVVELDRLLFDAALDDLIDTGVLRSDPSEPDRLSFAHVLVRDALYESLGLAERRSWHERIGRSLAAQHGTVSEAHVAEIAYHLFEAQTQSSLAETKILTETAAKAASARAAHDDAERYYSRAIRALALTDSSNASERCRLLLALGTEQCRAGNRSRAKKTFTAAASLARALGAAENLANAALGVAPGFLAVEVGVSDVFLEDLLQESLDNLGEGNSPMCARLAARLAMALHWSDSPDRMRASIELAKSIAERIDDPRARLEVLFARWFCEWHHADFGSRDGIVVELQSYAETLPDREMALIGTMLRLVGLLERGDTAAFDGSLETFAGMAANLRQPYSLWYETLYRSMRALLAGQLPRAANLLVSFQTVAARVQDANAMNSLIMQYSLLRWETGELEPMIGWIEEGARRSPTLQGFRAALAWANAKAGKESEAERELEALASKGFTDFPERFDWPISIALCSEVCSDLGDERRAHRLYELMKPLERRFVVLGLGVLSFGSADRLLGRLAETMGRQEEAEAHFRVAVERNAAAGAHAWTAHSKFDYALLLARMGDAARRDYWVRLASEALEAATDLGLMGLKARVEPFLQGASGVGITRRRV